MKNNYTRFVFLVITIVTSCNSGKEHIEKAVKLIDQKEFEQALAYLSLYSDSTETDPDYFQLKGAACTGMGDYNKALYYYEMALRFGNKSETVYSNAGDAAFKIGEYEKAMNYFYKVFRMDSTFENVNYNLGIIWWLDLENMEIAREYFHREIKLSNSADAMSAIGQTYVNISSYDSAFHYFKKALALDPNSLQNRAAMGFAYLNVDSPSAAMRHFEMASEIDPSNQEFTFFLCLSEYLSGSEGAFCSKLVELQGTDYELIELKGDSMYAEMKAFCDL